MYTNKINLLISLIFLLLFSCGHPLDFFYKEIAKYGYHNYAHPMKVAGTGTLVSGSSKSVDIIAHPYTCFPKDYSKLRCKDETKLPDRTVDFSIDVDLKAKLFDTLQSATPSIKANFRMKEVQRIDLKMSGIHIEFLDILKFLNSFRVKCLLFVKKLYQKGLAISLK